MTCQEETLLRLEPLPWLAGWLRGGGRCDLPGGDAAAVGAAALAGWLAGWLRGGGRCDLPGGDAAAVGAAALAGWLGERGREV